MVTITDATGEVRVTAHEGDVELEGVARFDHKLEGDPTTDGFRYRIVGHGGGAGPGRNSIYCTPGLLRALADSLEGAAERLR